MSRTMGSLLIDLRLNLNDFNRDIEAAKQRASIAGKAIEASLNIDINKSVANQYKATARAFGKPLKPIVDDSSLTALNKHLDLKQKHWADVRRDFEKPIKPAVLPLPESVRSSATSQPGRSGAPSIPEQTSVKIEGGDFSKGLEQAVRDGVKSANTKGILDTLMGPLKSIGNTIGSIATGSLEGIGRELTKEVSQGFVSGLQGVASPLIGDFNLVGSKLGHALASNAVEVAQREFKLLHPIIREVLDPIVSDIKSQIDGLIGEEDIAIAASKRKYQTAAQKDRDRGMAQKQVGKDVGQFEQEQEAPLLKDERLLKARKSYLAGEFDSLANRIEEKRTKADSTMAYAVKVQEAIPGKQTRVDQLGQMRLDPKMSKDQVAAIEVERDRVIKTINGLVVEAEQMEAEASKLYKEIEDLIESEGADLDAVESALAEQESAIASRRAEFEQRQNQIVKKQNLVGKPTKSRAELKREAEAAQSKVQTEQQRSAAAQAEVRYNALPKPYQRLVGEMGQQHGVNVPMAAVPQLVHDPSLKGFSNASYDVKKNQINVSQEILDSLGSGKLSKEVADVLVHELQHGFQEGLGKSIAPLKQKDLLTPTAEEAKAFGANIEASTDAVRAIKNPAVRKEAEKKLRSLEADAYTFSHRNRDELADRVNRQMTKEQSFEEFGVGGGKAKLEVHRAAKSATAMLEKHKQVASSVGVNFDHETDDVIAQVAAVKSALNESAGRLADIDLLGADEIEKIQAEVRADLSESLNKLDALQKRNIQAIGEKRSALKTGTAEMLETHSLKKTIQPMARELGIETKGKSKQELIAQISANENTQEVHDYVTKITRDRAQQRLARRDRTMAVANQAGAIARDGVEAVKVAGERAQEFAQSPRVQRGLAMAGAAVASGANRLAQSAPIQAIAGGSRNALNAAGATAGLGYKALQGVESVVLDAMPFGRTAKAIGQQFVLPAAGYMAASHMLPGGQMLAQGLHGAIGGAVSPMAHALGGGLADSASTAIAHSIPNIGGIQQAMVGGVTQLIESASTGAASAMTGLAEMAIGGRLAATGAKQALNASGRAIGALPPVMQPLALPPGKSEPLLALPAIASPVRDMAMVFEADVESSGKKAAAAIAHAGQAVATTVEAVVVDVSAATVKVESTKPKGQQADRNVPRSASPFKPTTKVAEVVPPEMPGVDALIVARAKTTAVAIKNQTTAIKAALKHGDITTAEKWMADIAEMAKNALNDIGEQAKNLTDPKAMGAAGNTRVNNAKSQIAKAVNTAEREIAKAKRGAPRSAAPPEAASGDQVEPVLIYQSDTRRSAVRAQKKFTPKTGGTTIDLEDIDRQANISLDAIGENIRKRVKLFRPKELSSQEKADQYVEDLPSVKRGKALMEEADKVISKPIEAIPTVSYGMDVSGLKQKQTIFGAIKAEVTGLIDSMGGLNSIAIRTIGGFLGFQALQMIIPMLGAVTDASTKAAMEMQRIDRVIAAGTGSSYKGKAAIASIGKQADELGLNKRQALQGYAQFAGSTKDTALEGDTGLGIFKNVGQAMGAQGVGGEQQERVFTALSQMASKGVVSMEELRQQVGESLPGALSIAARSMGMTTMEFSKLVESGELLSSDFLPKFAQQLAAESSTGLAGSAGSAQASLTRLGNSITDLQTSIGESILPVQKIGADVLVGAIGALIPLLEMAAKSAIGMGVAFAGQAAIGFVSSGAAAKLMAKGLTMIGPAIAKALAVLAPMLAKFILMSVAIDAARAAFDALSVGLGGGTSKFQEFANTAAKSMNEYRDALKSASEAQKDLLSSLPDKPQDVKGEAVVDKIGLTGVGRFVGGLFGNAKGGGDLVRAIEEVPIKALGGTTTAQQSSYVRQIGMNNQLEGRSIAKLEVAKQLFSDNGEVAQLKLIDKELESIQSKKRALAVKDPTNFDAVKQLTDREQELTKKREKSSAAVGKLQQSVSQEIELYKSAIKELEQLAGNGEISRDEYVNKLERYKAAIQGAEQDQNKLNKALKDTATSVESFERAWSKIADRMEDAATAAKSVNDGQRVAIARRELAGGTQGSGDRSAELMGQAQLAAKIKNDQQAAQAMRAILVTQGAETVRKNFGVTDQTGPAELKTLSDKATGPKEKAILARMGDLKRIEGDLKSSEADLAEAQVAAQRRLKDLTKSVADFYRGIEQQAKESALNAKSASIDIRSNNAKSKIVGALRGFQDNYISEFADSLVSLIDSFNEPFKIAIEAQKQILQKSQQLDDTMRQGSELSKQLPTGNEGMGPGSATTAAVVAERVGGGGNGVGDRIMAKAKSWVGKSFRPGVEAQCQEFVNEALNSTQKGLAAGIGTTKKAIDGLASGPALASRFFGKDKSRIFKDKAQARPGDLVSFGGTYGGYGKDTITHVGIYAGNGQIIDRPTKLGPVKLRSLDTFGKGNYTFARPYAYGEDRPAAVSTGRSMGAQPRSYTTQQPGRGAAVSGAAMAAGNDDSYFMRAIGYSEGNRTIDGGRTKSYARHWDNVGKRWGSGSVSDVHGRTGAQVYTHWNKVMAQDVDAARPRMKTAGLGGDRQVALNIADMSVQSPLALKAAGGFIEKLPQLARALEGVVGLSSRQKVIDEFKAESYRNPKTGRLQTSFSSKAALLHDQNRRGTALVEFMGRNDPQAALQGSAAPKPNPYVAPRGVMMPTTSMGVGQIAQAESQAGAYAGLGDRVKAATSMAGQTAFAENTQIMQSAAAQSALKRMEYERSQRKAQRQLTVGGRTMAKDSQGLSDQFDDLLAGIGPDTAQKGLGENLRKSKQTFRGYNESIRDAIELRESALMDAKALSKLIASGQIQGVDPSVAKSLDAQIGPMEKQLQNLYATRKQVSAAEAKVIADYRDKYALDLKARSAEVKSGLTAAQRKSATEEATLLKAQAEVPGIGPEKRDRNITRAASLDRYVAQDQAKSDFDRQKLELEKLQRDQPDAFKPGDFAARMRLLNEGLARQLQSADAQFANATAGIKQGAADRSIEQAAAAMRQTIEGFNAQAQSLEVRAKELEASGDPLGAFDVRKEAAQVKFQGDSASKSLELSQAIEEQEKLVRANQRTREEADRAIAKLREQNGISMANLTGELSNVTRELEKQKAAATAALEGRVREAEGQGQQLQIRKMTRTGRGMEAIGAQRDIDLNKIDFDLKARLRDLELDDSVPKEIKAKLRGLLTDNAGLESEEVSFNAKIALEDNQAQRRSLGAQSEMSILNAQASLAKTYGNDSSDYERQSAIIGENERFAESLRSIDAQARQMGLGAEEILKLKEAAGQLNGLNLENISAQFNPMVEAMNGVKGAFQGFLGDVISGNESIGDAFSKMVGNVGNMLAQLAAKLITQQLFSGLLGGLGGGGAAAGGGGGFLGGLFGFAEGGIVPEANHGPLRDRKDAIGAALRKEGPRSVLATLTPGEMVLTVQETRAYLNSSMRRSAQNGLAPTGRMRQAETIHGFKTGGIVPGGGPISITNGGSQSNINIPITINSAGGEQPSVNPRRLEDAVRAVVISEQRKAARPRSGR